jgi:hypothetical protein
MQAAIFGMETFEVSLRGQHFKLFTDHKPLEKLGKVHTKMLNQLQQMMNQFSFEIIYKQGRKCQQTFCHGMQSTPLNSIYPPTQGSKIKMRFCEAFIFISSINLCPRIKLWLSSFIECHKNVLS